MRLMDKVAIITGAASGIGKGCAQRFAKEGAKVIIADLNGEKAEETAKSIRESNGNALAVKIDMTKSAEVEVMIKTVLDHYGKIDILLNNAGIAMAGTPLETLSEESYDRIMTINIKSVFLGCKYIIPVMKKQGWGVIINTASLDAIKARSGCHVYSASKGAVISLTKALAIELAPFNIRVNCINPATTDTPMLNNFLPAGQYVDDARRKLLSAIPLGRWASVEDVANSALYLVSDESSFLTGIEINVNGGYAV